MKTKTILVQMPEDWNHGMCVGCANSPYTPCKITPCPLAHAKPAVEVWDWVVDYVGGMGEGFYAGGMSSPDLERFYKKSVKLYAVEMK